MKRGELYRIHKPSGGDPKAFRVFVIVGRQAVVESRFSRVICAPVYTNGEGLETQVPVGIDEGLKHHSWISCDNLNSIEKSELTFYVGSLSKEKLAWLNRALKAALDL